MRSKVVVALSGGVDSAFSAAALKERGWEVFGLHFILPAPEKAMAEKAEAVHEIADHLHIPVEIVDLRATFTPLVVIPFVDAYLEGMTPNPCVLCNPVVKFAHLLRFADREGIRYAATGHYARVERREGSPLYDLKRGRDPGKEQSYFLQRLTQAHLSRAVFPLGDLHKRDVRVHALRMALPVHASPESQEICFLPQTDYRSFIEEERGMEAGGEGRIVDTRGEVLGTHGGTHRYTIGQRHGLGLASSRPYYVKEIRPEANELVVGRKEELFSRTAEAEDFSWVEGAPPKRMKPFRAQVRYRHRAAPGRLEVISRNRVRFHFDEPQWAVTPGQALACYAGERVLGGGWIMRESIG